MYRINIFCLRNTGHVASTTWNPRLIKVIGKNISVFRTAKPIFSTLSLLFSLVMWRKTRSWVCLSRQYWVLSRSKCYGLHCFADYLEGKILKLVQKCNGKLLVMTLILRGSGILCIKLFPKSCIVVFSKTDIGDKIE